MYTAIKLGGSVITDKDASEPTVRLYNIERLIKEIIESKNRPKILTNGAGSFGHPLVRNYLEGKINDINKIHQSVLNLYKLMLDNYKKFGLDVFPIVPSDTCEYLGTDKRGHDLFNMKKLGEKAKEAIKKGLIATTFGDMVKAKKGIKGKIDNHAVLSADVTTAYLAKLLKCEKIIWVVDVDGIYTKNPKLHKDAELIKRVDGFEEKIEFELSSIDVSDGIRKKLEESQKVKIKSQFVNGFVKGNLRKALDGEEKIGTLFIPK